MVRLVICPERRSQHDVPRDYVSPGPLFMVAARRVTQPATKKPRRPGRGKGMGKQNYRVRYTRRDDSRLNRRHVSLTK